MYEPRFYRSWTKDKDLVPFNVVIKETDLFVMATRNLKKKATQEVLKQRASLEAYIGRHPDFGATLSPIEVTEDSPQIVKTMAKAAATAGVGPMAAVAGAMAECVGRELLPFSQEVIVENGGDVFIRVRRRRLVGIYAADSPFTGTMALEIRPEETPLGICTSSGTVGHSLSFGKADACIAISLSTALADASATAIGNLVIKADDIDRGLEFARGIKGLEGAVIIKNDHIGMWGRVNLVPVGG